MSKSLALKDLYPDWTITIRGMVLLLQMSYACSQQQRSLGHDPSFNLPLQQLLLNLHQMQYVWTIWNVAAVPNCIRLIWKDLRDGLTMFVSVVYSKCHRVSLLDFVLTAYQTFLRVTLCVCVFVCMCIIHVPEIVTMLID